MNKASSSTKLRPEEAEILCGFTAGNPRESGGRSLHWESRELVTTCALPHMRFPNPQEPLSPKWPKTNSVKQKVNSLSYVSPEYMVDRFRNSWIQVLTWFLHEILSSSLGLPCYSLALSAGSWHLQVCLIFIAHSLVEPECLFLCHSSQNPGISFHWTLLDHVLISGPVTDWGCEMSQSTKPDWDTHSWNLTGATLPKAHELTGEK